MHSKTDLIGRTKSYHGRASGNYFIGTLALVAAVTLFSGIGQRPDERTILSFVAVIAAIVGMILIIQGIRDRLIFTNKELIKQGLFTKRLAYVEIASLKWSSVRMISGQAPFNTAQYEVKSKNGMQIKIVPINYENKHEWAILLLDIVNEHHISTDSKIRQQLELASKESYQQPKI